MVYSVSSYNGRFQALNGLLRSDSSSRGRQTFADLVKKLDGIGKSTDEKVAPYLEQIAKLREADSSGKYTKQLDKAEEQVRDVKHDVDREIAKATKELKELFEKRNKYGDSEFAKRVDKAFQRVYEEMRDEYGDLDKAAEKLQDIGRELGSDKGSSKGTSHANSREIDHLGAALDRVSDGLRDLSSEVSTLERKQKDDAKNVDKKLDKVNDRLDDLSNDVQHSATELGRKFDVHSDEVNERLDSVDDRLDGFAKKLDEKRANIQIENAERVKVVNKQFKGLEDGLGKLSDEIVNKVDDLAKRQDTGFSEVHDRIDTLEGKVDEGLGNVNERIDNLEGKVDDGFNNLSSQIGSLDQKVEQGLSDIRDQLNQLDTTQVQQQDVSNEIQGLRTDFNKQISQLQKQHDEEINALLAKLDEVTAELKKLSEQSKETASLVGDKLGLLGSRFDTLLARFDEFAQGSMSLRSVNMFMRVAKTGEGAIDKLIGVMGADSNPMLQNLQFRLLASQSRLGGRFGGAMGLSGLSLMA